MLTGLWIKEFLECLCNSICSLVLTHWGRVTHICVGNPIIIGPDNRLSPGRRQAIIWTNAEILLIGPWGTNYSDILIGIHAFSFKKIHLKMSSAKWRPFCLGLNVLASFQLLSCVCQNTKLCTGQRCGFSIWKLTHFPFKELKILNVHFCNIF